MSATIALLGPPPIPSTGGNQAYSGPSKHRETITASPRSKKRSKRWGYDECTDDSLEEGVEKVALYGSGLLYTHAARQLPDGRWTSKLGKAEDIGHDTSDAVAGELYGEVVQFMKRTLMNG